MKLSTIVLAAALSSFGFAAFADEAPAGAPAPATAEKTTTEVKKEEKAPGKAAKMKKTTKVKKEEKKAE